MFKKAAVVLLICLAGFAAVAGCKPGNFEVGDWCCKAVGDGSAFSCTDGTVWILVE